MARGGATSIQQPMPRGDVEKFPRPCCRMLAGFRIRICTGTAQRLLNRRDDIDHGAAKHQSHQDLHPGDGRIGTVIGAIIGAAITLATSNLLVLTILLFVFGLLMFSSRGVNLSVVQIFFTPFIIILLNILYPGEWYLAFYRVLAVSIGVAIDRLKCTSRCSRRRPRGFDSIYPLRNFGGGPWRGQKASLKHPKRD